MSSSEIQLCIAIYPRVLVEITSKDKPKKISLGQTLEIRKLTRILSLPKIVIIYQQHRGIAKTSYLRAWKSKSYLLSAVYGCLTNHPRIQCFKTATISLAHNSESQKFRLSSAEWFFCWSHLSRMNNSSWFPWDFPRFSTESPASQEIHQSQENKTVGHPVPGVTYVDIIWWLTWSWMV